MHSPITSLSATNTATRSLGLVSEPCGGADQPQVRRATGMAAVLTLHHTPVGGVCDGIDVRGHLVPLLALIHVHNLFRVDGQVLIRIDDHTEQT